MSTRRPMALLLPPLAAALLAVATLAAPALARAATIEMSNGLFSSKIVGSGKVVDDRRSVAPFSRIRLDSAITVNARPAAAAGVTVRADDNLAPLILTTVEGDTLVVKVKPNSSFRTESPLVVAVDFTRLTHADLRGSGDLNIAALKGEQFELSLAGSGDVRLAGAELQRVTARLAGSGDIWINGRSDEASFSLAGSGDVHAAELSARRVSVDIAGSGDVRVNATDSLAVQIAGSGDVAYSGNPPKVTRRIVGSGDLRQVR